MICYISSSNYMNVSLGKHSVLFCSPSVSIINAFNLLLNKYVLDNLVRPPSSKLLWTLIAFSLQWLQRGVLEPDQNSVSVLQSALSNATIWLHAHTSTKASPRNRKYKGNITHISALTPLQRSLEPLSLTVNNGMLYISGRLQPVPGFLKRVSYTNGVKHLQA